MFNIENLIWYLLCIPASLISLTVHEFAHGYAAYKLGDPTAKAYGRLTLNPLAHLDPIGTVCMVLFRFGWAKPVPVNPRYFRNPRNGMAITAAAGPISNLILAVLSALFVLLTGELTSVLYPYIGGNAFLVNFMLYLQFFFQVLHILNLTLCVFNLIPLPPLDGSRILYVFLPDKYYFGVMKYERTIRLVLLIALALGAFTGIVGTFTDILSNLIYKLWLLIPFFA